MVRGTRIIRELFEKCAGMEDSTRSLEKRLGARDKSFVIAKIQRSRLASPARETFCRYLVAVSQTLNRLRNQSSRYKANMS